jgi:hypothetical protein
MRSGDAAGLLLSLVTSQERAASMVGDLLEGERNRWRFWLAVVRTALAQLWRQVAAAPFSMTRTAIVGMFAEFLYMVAAAVFAWVMLLCVVSVSRVAFHYNDLPAWLFQEMPNWVLTLLVPLALGRWMFRRCPGHEAVGTLTLALLHASITVLAGWLFWLANGDAHADVIIFVRIIYWHGDILHTLGWMAYYLTLYPVLMLAGAAAARAHSLIRDLSN